MEASSESTKRKATEREEFFSDGIPEGICRTGDRTVQKLIAL
jgi:hypothetical protein